MKKKRLIKTDRKELLRELSSETAALLARKNARLSLVIAYVFTVSMAGLGLIISYLLLNELEYLSVRISDTVGYLVMFGFVYLFGAPAFASVRLTARAVCDGREVAIAEVFSVFSSLKSFGLSYLPMRAFEWLPRLKRGGGKNYRLNFRIAVKARMLLSNPLRFIGELLLSFLTCFIYFIIQAGPASAIRSELILRKVQYINMKNNERTVKRND